jgi:methionine aminopeptidase
LRCRCKAAANAATVKKAGVGIRGCGRRRQAGRHFRRHSASSGRAGGYGINTDYGGHGIGRTMHEAPSVPNEGRPGRGMTLKPGMTVAIEPWFLAGGDDAYRIDSDGWTLRSADTTRAAHVEHTIAVTDDGPVVLTTV